MKFDPAYLESCNATQSRTIKRLWHERCSLRKERDQLRDRVERQQSIIDQLREELAEARCPIKQAMEFFNG